MENKPASLLVVPLGKALNGQGCLGGGLGLLSSKKTVCKGGPGGLLKSAKSL